MTTKKYIFTFIIFFSMLVAALVLFFVGISFKEDSALIFYVFAAIACLSLISAIVFIAWNYKKLVAYDADRVRNKVKNLDFSFIDVSIKEDALRDKLKTYEYIQNAENLFHKKFEYDVGDGGIVTSHYYAAVFQSDLTIDISKCVGIFDKGLTTYNVGYIFINDNLETNLEILKEYIIETVVDVETHRYGYKTFFVPIIISADKIYYLNAGSFISEYKHGVAEGLRVLDAKMRRN